MDQTDKVKSRLKLPCPSVERELFFFAFKKKEEEEEDTLVGLVAVLVLGPDVTVFGYRGLLL